MGHEETSCAFAIHFTLVYTSNKQEMFFAQKILYEVNLSINHVSERVTATFIFVYIFKNMRNVSHKMWPKLTTKAPGTGWTRIQSPR
jgi:hypothetical protein